MINCACAQISAPVWDLADWGWPGIMNRPTTESTKSAFLLKTSWVSAQTLEPLNIEMKGYHYPYSNKAMYEIRHVLDIFYRGSTVKWTLKDFLKNNKKGFSSMFQMLEESWDTCIIPSLKAYAYQCTLGYRPSTPFIRQEWTISNIGIIGILLYMGNCRREGVERDRAMGMLAANLQELAFLDTWTYEEFMTYLDGTRTCCGEQTDLGNQFCPHVIEDLGHWMASARIVWWENRSLEFQALPKSSYYSKSS
jgi:hypothetical protein